MKILVLNNCKNMNGTHTVVYNIAKELTKIGHDVYRYNFNGIEARYIPDIKNYTKLISFKNLIIKNRLRLDVIFAPTANLFFFAIYLKKNFFNSARIVLGVFHPRQLNYEKCEPRQYGKKIEEMINKIDSKNIIFMNESVKKEHEKTFKICFKNSSIIPIPIEVQSYIERSKPKDKRIISVGRLIDFKQYPKGVIIAIAQLRERGIIYYYDIYGTGPLQEEYQNLIERMGLQTQVRLKGNISFNEINLVLQEAYLFIGMGASLLGACAQGVPSLCAHDSFLLKSSTTYGLYSEMDGYEVGEIREDIEKVPILDSLVRLANVSDVEYKNLSWKSYQKAKKFSSEEIAKKYLEVFSQASTSEGDFKIRIGYLIYLFFCKKLFRFFFVHRTMER